MVDCFLQNQNLKKVVSSEMLKMLSHGTALPTGKESLVEMTVDAIDFKDVREGYIFRLRKLHEEKTIPAPLNSRSMTMFSFNKELHCYLREEEDTNVGTPRGDNKSRFSGRHNSRRSTKIGVAGTTTQFGTDTSVGANPDFSLFQHLASTYINNTLYKIEEDVGKEDDKIELNELFEKVKQRKNYALFYQVKTKSQATGGEIANKNALLNITIKHVGNVEEENGHINRINKSREIEKEFKEKKLISVLLSNKETKKTLKESPKFSIRFVSAIVTIAIYVIVPLILAFANYTSSNNSINTVLILTQMLSYNGRVLVESAGVYNSMFLIGYMNTTSYTSFGDLTKSNITAMAKDRLVRAEQRLDDMLDKLNVAERAIISQPSINQALNKGYETDTLSFAAYSNSNNYNRNVSQIELRELVIIFS